MEQNVIAVVGGHEITEQELELFIQGLPQEQKMYASNPQFREQCKDQLITLHAFAKLGEEEKIDETDEFKSILESAKKDILAQLAMRQLLNSVTVSEEEIKEYYEAHKAQYAKGATVRAKHILTDSEEKCQQILTSITSGEKAFEDAAKESSSCPSGARGGDLGEFGKGQMVKEFEEAAFAAEVGHVVGPVQTQFGFHLIKVEEKNEAKEASFDEVKARVENEVLQQKQGKVYEEKVAELKAKFME